MRSRTQLVRFAPLSAAIVKGILDKLGLAPDIAEPAADLAGGSVAAALAAHRSRSGGRAARLPRGDVGGPSAARISRRRSRCPTRAREKKTCSSTAFRRSPVTSRKKGAPKCAYSPTPPCARQNLTETWPAPSTSSSETGPRPWYSKPWSLACDTGYSSFAVPKSALLLFLLGGLPNVAAEATPLCRRRGSRSKSKRPTWPAPGNWWSPTRERRPLRVAADGRLLTLEIEPPEDTADR